MGIEGTVSAVKVVRLSFGVRHIHGQLHGPPKSFHFKGSFRPDGSRHCPFGASPIGVSDVLWGIDPPPSDAEVCADGFQKHLLRQAGAKEVWNVRTIAIGKSSIR
jgi:hypothetical protein